MSWDVMEVSDQGRQEMITVDETLSLTVRWGQALFNRQVKCFSTLRAASTIHISVPWRCWKKEMKSLKAHRDDSLLLHAAWCVVEVSELHGHLVVDGQEKLLALLQLGLQLFAVGWTQLRGSCRRTKSQPLFRQSGEMIFLYVCMYWLRYFWVFRKRKPLEMTMCKQASVFFLSSWSMPHESDFCQFQSETPTLHPPPTTPALHWIPLKPRSLDGTGPRVPSEDQGGINGLQRRWQERWVIDLRAGRDWRLSHPLAGKGGEEQRQSGGDDPVKKPRECRESETRRLTKPLGQTGVDRIHSSHGLHQVLPPELDLHRSLWLQNSTSGENQSQTH